MTRANSKSIVEQIKEKEKVLIKKKATCPVCFDEYEPGTAYFLRNCTHVLHKECIKQYIKAEVEGGQCVLKCVEPKCKT